jgi:hypothetical protein
VTLWVVGRLHRHRCPEPPADERPADRRDGEGEAPAA